MADPNVDKAWEKDSSMRSCIRGVASCDSRLFRKEQNKLAKQLRLSTAGENRKSRKRKNLRNAAE